MNQSKKPTIYDLLFIVVIYALQSVSKHSSEMKNKYRKSVFTTSTVFPGLEPICRQKRKVLSEKIKSW